MTVANKKVLNWTNIICTDIHYHYETKLNFTQVLKYRYNEYQDSLNINIKKSYQIFSVSQNYAKILHKQHYSEWIKDSK